MKKKISVSGILPLSKVVPNQIRFPADRKDLSRWADLFFLRFLSEYTFWPNPPPLLLLVCSQFWSGLSGLAGLRWCKYHIQTAHCFLVLRVGVGGDDHSMENLSISIAMTLNPEFGAHKLSHLHQLAKMDPTSLTILKVRVIGWSRRS